jgi:hypothetical protein
MRQFGERHHRAKLTDAQASIIRLQAFLGPGWRQMRAALAKEYGVSPQTIDRICNGESWRHVIDNPPVGGQPGKMPTTGETDMPAPDEEVFDTAPEAGEPEENEPENGEEEDADAEE